MKPQILALYLPQFHPFPENDEWWGKGFTEWTNVGKAKKLFYGHYQPRVPADLGYYDLRLPLIREQQAEMAREAGVTAFCYWHYWFGNGRRLMADVFQEVLDSGKPDFPFCLAWANHTWRAIGCTAGNYDPRVLMEQTYPGLEDARLHFDFLLKAFKDNRYVKIDGKPFLFIYDSEALPEMYCQKFKEWTIEAGFPGLYLAGNLLSNENRQVVLDKGFDAVVYGRMGHRFPKSKFLTFMRKVWIHIRAHVLMQPPHVFDYRKEYQYFVTKEEYNEHVLPQLIPQWDHSPRTGGGGYIYTHSAPEYFYLHAKDALKAVRNKPKSEQIIMLKSWNEWAEGNYMEPDLKFGKGYIEALKRAVSGCEL